MPELFDVCRRPELFVDGDGVAGLLLGALAVAAHVKAAGFSGISTDCGRGIGRLRGRQAVDDYLHRPYPGADSQVDVITNHLGAHHHRKPAIKRVGLRVVPTHPRRSAAHPNGRHSTLPCKLPTS